jgi:hypothetical protein
MNAHAIEVEAEPRLEPGTQGGREWLTGFFEEAAALGVHAVTDLWHIVFGCARKHVGSAIGLSLAFIVRSADLNFGSEQPLKSLVASRVLELLQRLAPLHRRQRRRRD